MSARTVREILTQAARKSGVIGKTSDLDANEYEEAMAELNDIIETLELDGLWFASRDRYTVNTQHDTSNIILKRAGSLTVAAGDVVVPKIPSRVTALSYLIGQQWRPLQLISNDQLENSVRLSTVISYPVYYTYNSTDTDTGVVQLYPIPTQQQYQISVVDTKLDWGLDDVTNYPPAYDGYLTWAVAAALCRINGLDPSVAAQEAAGRLQLIETRQIQARMLKTHDGRGVYSIQSGMWSDGSTDFR